MAQLEVYEITNVSQQIVTFGYSTIDPNLALGVVDPREDGILKLVAGASTTIEAQRVELGELQEIQRKGLIRFEARGVQRADAPPPACFELEDKNYFVGFPVSIVPENIVGDVEYWSAPELPAPLSLNSATGEITAPVSATPYSVDFYVSAVGTNGLSCTQNYTLNVVEPDIIEMSYTATPEAAVPTGVNFTVPGFTTPEKATLANYWVDWGDGTVEYIDSTDSQIHTYAVVGNYTVRISGELDVFDRYYTSLLDPNFTFFTMFGLDSINIVRSDSLRSLNFGAPAFGAITSVPAIFDAPNVTNISAFLSGNVGVGPALPANILDGMPNVQDASLAFNVTGLSGTPASLASFLSSIPNVTVIDQMFRANPIAGPVPVTLFDDVPLLESVDLCFDQCTGINGVLPDNLFAGLPALRSARQFVQLTGLTAISPNLFINAPALEDVNGFYLQCGSLAGTIPPGMFNSPNLVDIGFVFTTTAISGTIPVGLLDNCPNVENIDGLFSSTSVTGTIPVGLLDNLPNLRSANGLFLSIGLTGSIPAGLFDNNPLLEEAGGRLFFNVGAGQPIPPNLFANNPLLRKAGVGGASIGTIPATLFANNPLLEDVNEAFSSMTNLVDPIPPNLFANNPLLEDLGSLFSGCTGLTFLPPTLFANNPEISNLRSFCLANGMTGVPPATLFANNRKLNGDGIFLGARFSTMPGGIFGSQPEAEDIDNLFTGFVGNSLLTSVGAGILDGFVNVTSAQRVFDDCLQPAFTTLPVGIWDNLTLLESIANCFINTNFVPAVFDDFLISLDTNNVATGGRFLSYDGSASGGHLDVNRSGPAAAAKANLITNGWIISGTY